MCWSGQKCCQTSIFSDFHRIEECFQNSASVVKNGNTFLAIHLRLHLVVVLEEAWVLVEPAVDIGLPVALVGQHVPAEEMGRGDIL